MNPPYEDVKEWIVNEQGKKVQVIVYDAGRVKLQFKGLWHNDDWLATETGQAGKILGSDLLRIAQAYFASIGGKCKLQVDSEAVYGVQRNVDKVTHKVVALNPFTSKTTGEEWSYVTLIARQPLVAGKAGF